MELRNSSDLSCCGIQTVLGFDYDESINVFAEKKVIDKIVSKLEDYKKKARKNNKALLVASTTPKQIKIGKALQLAGFIGTPAFNRQTNTESVNPIMLWFCPLNGHNVNPFAGITGEML